MPWMRACPAVSLVGGRLTGDVDAVRRPDVLRVRLSTVVSSAAQGKGPRPRLPERKDAPKGLSSIDLDSLPYDGPSRREQVVPLGVLDRGREGPA
jgi:hypothetical protein